MNVLFYALGVVVAGVGLASAWISGRDVGYRNAMRERDLLDDHIPPGRRRARRMTPAEQRAALIDALAPLVLEDRRREAERDPKKPPYYFINISHPVIRVFYLQWLAKHNEAAPPGDLSRTRFELSMLHTAALRDLASYYQEQGRLQNMQLPQ